jgi:hypothetical protein
MAGPRRQPYTADKRRVLGLSITANVSSEAGSVLAVDTNTNTFPGSVNHFVGRSRDAVATGTVVLDGTQFVNGSTPEAQIETLEDTNIDTPS